MTDGQLMTTSHKYSTFSASVNHFLIEKRQENSPFIRWPLLLAILYEEYYFDRSCKCFSSYGGSCEKSDLGRGGSPCRGNYICNIQYAEKGRDNKPT